MKNIFQFKSVRMKILTGFIITIVLVLGMSVLTFLGMKNNNDKTAEITETQLPLLNADTDLRQNTAEISSLVSGYLLEDDAELKEKEREKIKKGNETKEKIKKIPIKQHKSQKHNYH